MKYEVTIHLPMQKPRVFVVSADNEQEARKIADERSPISGCRIDVRETSRRKNPYDVYADEPDVAPSVAVQRRLMHEAAMPLPPAVPAFYADVEEHGAVPLTHVTDAGREIGMVRHGVDPVDLAVVQVLNEAEDERQKLEIKESVGLDVTDEEVSDLDAEFGTLVEDLRARGYGQRQVQQAQLKVWNRIKYVATKAAYRILGRRRDVDVEAVAAEGAVKAYMNIQQFQGTSKLSTWVYAIVRTIATDALTQSNMHRSRSVPSGITPLGGLGLGMTGARGATVERASVVGGSTGEGGLDVMAHPDFALSVAEDENEDRDSRAYALEALGADPKVVNELFSQQRLSEEKIAAAADEAYRERVDTLGGQQDTAVENVFGQLLPYHQQLLSLRSAHQTIQLPDGTEFQSQGETPYRVMAEVLGVPPGSLGRDLSEARKELMKLSGVKPPFVGPLTLRYLGLKPQGRPKLRKIRVSAVRGSEADRMRRAQERERAEAAVQEAAQRQIEAMNVADVERDLRRTARGRSLSKKQAEALDLDAPASISSDVMEYLASRPRETVWRRARQNPMVGEFAYYETAADLLDLWLSGMITQEQHDEHLAALMAEEGVDL